MDGEAGGTLTPATPVTLTWTNGAGSSSHAPIAIDDDYMFTVTDSGDRTRAPRALGVPLCRRGAPRHAAGELASYVLLEGLLGYVGDGLPE